MKNREKIMNTNLYDLLVKINLNLDCDTCIIELISDEESLPCEEESLSYVADCNKCIQEWLNAESKPNEQFCWKRKVKNENNQRK
jgi:hypothetical protein